MSAGCSPRPASTCRSTQLSAKFIRPPSNQRGHWTPRETSRTRVYGRLKRRPRSRTTASQYQSGSATLRRCSSSSELTPRERMKRASRVRSAYSCVGRQTISLVPVSVIRSSREGSVLGGRLLGQRGGECQDQRGVGERDQLALPRRERVVAGDGIPPALDQREEADHQDDEEQRRLRDQQRDDADGEPDREQPAPLVRVRADREQHGREGLELHDTGEEAEELRLAQNEQNGGPGRARRRLASIRCPALALSLRRLEALVHRPQVFDLA